ncbi:MAG: hypothetical protein CBD61_04235 [Pelagibacteraceae bacterium TMED201]|nr:MAG: hypothetical protein CBD61_04235 [Pelagibacteraceae bacterium TMED201]
MKNTITIKYIGLIIFIITIISINLCLILSQIFDLNNSPFALGDAIGDKSTEWIIPYIDGNNSISRVVRVFPNSLIFKPSMLLVGILLIFYWIKNKNLVLEIDKNQKHTGKILIFGILSSLCLIFHATVLGTEIDNGVIKKIRRIVLLLFIIFEVFAQAYLLVILYNIKNKIISLINIRFLFLKKCLVISIIFTAIISIPFLSVEGNTAFKHMLEWNYFFAVVFFYLLTFFLWRKI